MQAACGPHLSSCTCFHVSFYLGSSVKYVWLTILRLTNVFKATVLVRFGVRNVLLLLRETFSIFLCSEVSGAWERFILQGKGLL